MPRQNDTTLKDALQNLLRAYRLKGKVQETRVISHWEDIVGQTIGRYTDDVIIRNKTLIIRLRNPALKHELFYSRDKIKDLVNNFAEEELVTDVILR